MGRTLYTVMKCSLGAMSADNELFKFRTGNIRLFPERSSVDLAAELSNVLA